MVIYPVCFNHLPDHNVVRRNLLHTSICHFLCCTPLPMFLPRRNYNLMDEMGKIRNDKPYSNYRVSRCFSTYMYIVDNCDIHVCSVHIVVRRIGSYIHIGQWLHRKHHYSNRVHCNRMASIQDSCNSLRHTDYKGDHWNLVCMDTSLAPIRNNNHRCHLNCIRMDDNVDNQNDHTNMNDSLALGIRHGIHICHCPHHNFRLNMICRNCRLCKKKNNFRESAVITYVFLYIYTHGCTRLSHSIVCGMVDRMLLCIYYNWCLRCCVGNFCIRRHPHIGHGCPMTGLLHQFQRCMSMCSNVRDSCKLRIKIVGL